jgi:acyl-coenzyme A synthetase/AMP-(fatty) acid ligase
MVTLLLSNPLLPLVDLSRLRLVTCGGSPQSPAAIARVVAALGCEFAVSYGMTECCGKISISLLPADWLPHSSEVGTRSTANDTLMARVCTSGRPFLLMEVRHYACQ